MIFHDEEVTQRISDRFNSRSSYDQSAKVHQHQTSALCRMDGEWMRNAFSWYSSPLHTTMVRLLVTIHMYLPNSVYIGFDLGKLSS